MGRFSLLHVLLAVRSRGSCHGVLSLRLVLMGALLSGCGRTDPQAYEFGSGMFAIARVVSGEILEAESEQSEPDIGQLVAAGYAFYRLPPALYDGVGTEARFNPDSAAYADVWRNMGSSESIIVVARKAEASRTAFALRADGSSGDVPWRAEYEEWIVVGEE